MFADVILPLNLPQALTYGVPIDMQGALRVGMRVEVTLGKNKQYSGVVDRIHNDKPEAYLVKPIRNILDEAPIVNVQQLALWRWISHYYMAAPGEVLQAALPAHLKLMAETRLEWVGDADVDYNWSNETYIIVQSLKLKKEITISELRELTGPKHFTTVLDELLSAEVTQINDNLEPAYAPKKEKVVSLAPHYSQNEALKDLFDQLKRAPRQINLLMAIMEINAKKGIVKLQELLERTDSNSGHVKPLVDKGIFIIEEKFTDRIPISTDLGEKEITFTPAQQTAYDELNEGLAKKDVVLLQGVTGSGKTLLYVEKIRECLAQGRQALFLLPEIGLTTQLVGRLQAYFGDSLGVYHSHFSNNERVEIWDKVRKGRHKVVVGARSALWLPYSNLGLIIVDEEHDASFKQRDPAPRFHARDAAIYMSALFKAKVILGSATPSIESLFNAQQNKYAFVALKERYMGLNLPTIELVDARSLELVKQLGFKIITPELQQAITEALKDHKQVILFQNKRGYAPFLLCQICGWVPQCKNCSVSLTYHKSTDKMHCHYCGLKSPVTHNCPSCGSQNVVSKSYGTEKIEEEVQLMFPKARVARMDVDSMRRKNSITELLAQLDKHKVDILVGTQMVVKGLDFAGVSLVGILSADSLLSFPDFRVNERGFQLMEQVSGRAGRTDGKGRVLIQAYNLQHPALQWVKEHNLGAFYKHEIKFREFFAYPPFNRIIKIIFRHKDEAKSVAAAMQMAAVLNSVPGIVVQGPGPALIARVREQYIQEIWLKCPRDNKLIESVKSFLRSSKQHILAQTGNSSINIIFDVDPV